MVTLKRDAILEAAAEVLDRGPEALTMRALADRLGVSAAALYHWFPAKAQLLDAIAEHVAARIVATGQHGASWEDRLRSLAIGLVEASQQHPETFRWVVFNYASRPALAKVDEAMLDVLIDAGFGAREAVLAKGTVLRFVIGHLGLATLPTTIDLATVDPATYPRVYQVAGEAAELSPTDLLAYGLDHVIASLAPARRDTAPDTPPSGSTAVGSVV